MKTFSYRVLIIDDDLELMRRMTEILKGVRVSVGKREAIPTIEQFPVGVVFEGGEFKFTEQTLSSFMALAKRRFDYIMIDYAYTDRDRQRKQWNEGDAKPEKAESNEHLLTVADLKVALEEYDKRTGGANKKRLAKFFAQRSIVLLRSFQHDRPRDKLQAFSHRHATTRGIFAKSPDVVALDGFQMIYGADAELRETFYHGAPRGRELYRNVVVALSSLNLESSMNSYLARKSGQLLVARRSVGLAAMVVVATTLATLFQPLGQSIIDYLAVGDYLLAGRNVLIGLAVIGIATFLTTFILERWVGSIFESAERRE